MNPAPATAALAPTHARYRVVGFCCALAVVTYLDRACIGVLAPDIRRDLGLSMQQMSYVFSAFTLAYAIFEIPSAMWGERIGARLVLARIVGWWSAFTLLTAAVTGYASLLVVRFLFGAGEAGAWPNATRVFSRWIPAHERGRVQGVFFAGAHLAAGITPPLVLLMSPLIGWRGVFIVFGALGFVWAWAWLRWFRDRPADHPAVNPAELALIADSIAAENPPAAAHLAETGSLAPNQPPLWRSVLRSPDVWLLSLIAFASGYGFYFVITWLPTFLSTLGFTAATLAVYSGLPMIFAVPADILGGVATDFAARKFGVRIGRAIVGASAFAVAAAAMFGAIGFTGNPHATALLLAVAGGASMFALAASWSTCIELGAEHSGIVSATMNTAGQVGGILSPIVLAWLVDRSGAAGKWLLPLQLIGGFYLIAAVSWLFINPRRTINR